MKIDTTSIENYANLSPEEKIAALEAFEYSDNSDKYKKSFDDASSQVASLKKQLKELESAKDSKKSDAEKQLEELKEQFAELKAQSARADYKAKFMAKGYSEELAIKQAELLPEGIPDEYFENLGEMIKARDKAIKAEAVKGVSKPSTPGAPTKVMTRDDLKKMTPDERFKWSQEHREEYSKMYSK